MSELSDRQVLALYFALRHKNPELAVVDRFIDYGAVWAVKKAIEETRQAIAFAIAAEQKEPKL